MPVCKGCGESYADEFKFCPNCGRVKPEPETIKVDISINSNDKWETCKITLKTPDSSRDLVWQWQQFKAIAIKKSGGKRLTYKGLIGE